MRVCFRALAAALAVNCVVANPSEAQTSDRPKSPLTLNEYLADPYQAVRDFGRCAAAFNLMADLYAAGNRPQSAEEMRGAARGALAAGQMLAMTDVVKEDDAAAVERIRTHMLNLESFEETEATRLRAAMERGQLGEAALRFCVDLQEVQILAIEAMRRSGVLSSGENSN